jgi:hypothetical protein
MYPTYRIPITFTSVEVRDTVTKEPLEPGLVLYDEEPVHLLMASSWVGTREDFEKEFSEGPHLSAEGGKLTSKNIVLGAIGQSGTIPRNMSSTISSMGSSPRLSIWPTIGHRERFIDLPNKHKTER